MVRDRLQSSGAKTECPVAFDRVITLFLKSSDAHSGDIRFISSGEKT